MRPLKYDGEEGKEATSSDYVTRVNNRDTIYVFHAYPYSFDSGFVQTVSSPKHEHCMYSYFHGFVFLYDGGILLAYRNVKLC
jgi:hypothetical protein